MSASPASYNVTLATLRTSSPNRSKSRNKRVRQQTEKEKRRARLLKKLEIVALRERGFAAHNVRFCRFFKHIIHFLFKFKQQFLMSHKVHLVARLNVIATNFGYFGLSYVMLMRLVEISSGASSYVARSFAFFFLTYSRCSKYSFLHASKKKKIKKRVEIQKYEYKKYENTHVFWIRNDG